jgi:hypothetical protein
MPDRCGAHAGKKNGRFPAGKRPSLSIPMTILARAGAVR